MHDEAPAQAEQPWPFEIEIELDDGDIEVLWDPEEEPREPLLN